MTDDLIFYQTIMGLAGAAMTAVGAYLIFSDVMKKNPWALALVVAVIGWIIGDTFESLTTGEKTRSAWNAIKYIGISCIGPSWFGVAARFTASSRWLGSKGTATILSSAALFSVAVITDPIHGLLVYNLPPLANARLFSAGPLWYALMAFLIACIIGGLVLIVKNVPHFPRITQRRGKLIFVVIAGPAIVGILDMLPLPLPYGLRLTPFAVVIASLILFYGFIRLRLVSPLGLARETIIDMLTDPVIVIDESLRIALVNPAAASISNEKAFARPGIRLDEAFPALKEIAINEVRNERAEWSGGGKKYIARTTLIEKTGSLSRAIIITLSDVTNLLSEQERLERIVEERTLQLKTSNDELALHVAKLTESEYRLTEALAEKELLLKEIHHRVKNNLQIVTSLIKLQSNRLTSPEAKAACADLKTRIGAIGLVHERIYRASASAKVDLGQYVRELVALIASSVAERDLPVTVEIPETSMLIHPDTCIDIGLIINELVVNAVKHGRRPEGSGKVAVRVRADGEAIELQVRDIGPGFASDNPERTGSLGMKIIQAIASKYRAVLSFRNEGGAVATVAFPAYKILKA